MSDSVLNIIEQTFVWLIILAFILSELIEPEIADTHPPIVYTVYGDSILLHLEAR